MNNQNKGALFVAEKKTDKSPDFTGVLDVDGVAYNVSGWKNVSQNGKKYVSLSVKKKEETKQPEKAYDNLNDEIPF